MALKTILFGKPFVRPTTLLSGWNAWPTETPP